MRLRKRTVIKIALASALIILAVVSSVSYLWKMGRISFPWERSNIISSDIEIHLGFPVTRDYDLIRGHHNLEVGFTITALNDIPFWEPYAPGNTMRIEALKKAHEMGIKTFVSIEPWIPEITYPQSIMEKLRAIVDRFIIGSMQYCDVPRSFYAKKLPALISWLKENKIDYYLKKELRSCLKRNQP